MISGTASLAQMTKATKAGIAVASQTTNAATYSRATIPSRRKRHVEADSAATTPSDVVTCSFIRAPQEFTRIFYNATGLQAA
jgi:hypothetical protein